MSTSNLDTFGSTIAGLEAGLRVRDIATFDLVACSLDDRIEHLFDEGTYLGIDQFPVRDGHRVVGVVERTEGLPTGSVVEVMRPLDDSILISSESPISHVLPLMKVCSYRLVMTGSSITGIVTRSDLLKLPVRVLTFTLVTHIGLLLAELIRQRHPDDDAWLGKLSPGRRNKLFAKHKQLTSTRIDLPLLEVTQFCDKRDVVRKLYELSTQFTGDLEKIEDLRNVVAHAGTYAENDTALLDFVSKVELTQDWIEKLGRLKHGRHGDGNQDLGLV